ncbi:hypothetical protein C8035_v005590 [Colletotrichum spinosum]|uniref:Uncharacterized protein n=1 Tax=Colletotrichum spinosum TaxID=1347390 RepID=A0A4R8QQE3_9PEZI|nr:hypothetical protein C8035_v005590 [Colletotrichum spinosum]
MKGLSGTFADLYTTWLSPLTHCCTPLSHCLPTDENKRQNLDISEKVRRTAVTRDQPVPMPPPFAGNMQKPAGPCPRPQLGKAKGVKRSFASLRERFSVRKRFRSDSSSIRRLQISGPTNFRHLHSESFQFPQYTSLQTVGRPLPPRPTSRPRPSSFRPLELSIYIPKRELSPILPHFEMLTPLPSARVQPNPNDDVFGLSHEPSYSPMSFHLPRKMSMSPSTTTMTTPDDTPPRIPPKSRARSQTSSSVERMKERIAGAMLEVDKLQREIDLIRERQNIYSNSSRPSTSYSMAMTVHDLEPMPTVPALPPLAPSFAQRLNPGAERPHTAPPRPPVHIPHRGMTFADASAAFVTPPPSRGREPRPPPPPLPLVLRPPLRKKKSFSRVSSWLFPGVSAAADHHRRNFSHDSITNLPRPVKGREGFYQCVHAPRDRRTSFDTASTVSAWESEEDGDRGTAPTTTWSPGSTLATKAEEHLPPLERVTTFGKEKVWTGSRRGSVGVAF